ncbi:MAG: cytochrome c oxidase subunit 3 [Myxococcaceae bacterium]|nr:cytochrome c oxidase subunit 3 [Myxococcaceae bacterium]
MERELAPQFASVEQEARAWQFGMWVFLSTEVLFFGGLFIAYGVYRFAYPQDFHLASSHMNVWLGTANTLVLLTSSLFVALALHLVRHERSMWATLALVLALLLGVVFMVFKGLEYAEHAREGLLPGVYFASHKLHSVGALQFVTLYWLMTGLHALHVTIGLFVLAWTAFQAASGFYSPRRMAGLEIGGMYWHFVDVIWVFLYPLLYLV